MRKLVIAEKPSVAQAIAAVLHATERKDGFLTGNGWIVSWCVGHLVELAPADAYGEQYAKWRLADLPIAPDHWKHIVPSNKKKQFDILRKLLTDKNVDSVVCATDAGREGELIFRLVYEQAGCKKPIQRLWISSMEESAIAEGFRNLRPGADYERLYQAALCRSQADWLVGINATRLFSCLYGVTLNVGRVQTPTLAMLVKREADIAAFVSEPFYTPFLDCGGFTASGEKSKDRQEADAVHTACDGKQSAVTSVERQEKTTAPPHLYDLTTLQREANRLFGFTAQQTLDYTQALYEKKLCTYPRTDSRFLTTDMRETAGALVTLLLLRLPFAQGIAFTPDIDRVTDNSKVSDHHGIIPTSQISKADLAELPAGERDILQLIAARLLCATAPTHRFVVVTAAITCAGYTFTTRGRTTLQNGWKAVNTAFRATLKEKPKDEDTEDGDALPELIEGQIFPSVTASVREGKTKPPRTFTEDLLLSAMELAGAEDMPDDVERKGLGTPATRAGIIERLVKTGLVNRKARQLLPSQKAVNLISVLPDVVKSPLLTAEWEYKLGQIERGELAADDFIRGIADMTSTLIHEHSTRNPNCADLFITTSSGDVIGACLRCGGSVREYKKGFFCDSKPCGFALWKDNKFFAAKRKILDKKIAAALLTEGRIFLSGLYSEKTGKIYDAFVVLEDTGKYVNFRLEFKKGDKK